MHSVALVVDFLAFANKLGDINQMRFNLPFFLIFFHVCDAVATQLRRRCDATLTHMRSYLHGFVFFSCRLHFCNEFSVFVFVSCFVLVSSASLFFCVFVSFEQACY